MCLSDCRLYKGQDPNIIKASVPTIINGLQVILSLSDKAKLFARNFVFNYMLKDKVRLFSTFYSHRLFNISIMAWNALRFIKNIDHKKKILGFVFGKIL